MYKAETISVASIPSPTWSSLSLGSLTIHMYAICILLGMLVAFFVSAQRWKKLDASADLLLDITLWAVPFGIIGGRIYHVLTSPSRYFGENGNIYDVIKIWEGGLGIWGAIAFGVLGAWIACKRKNVQIVTFLDVVAPGVLLAQGIGRWGNWFNQEIFGKPTTLPWGLEISPNNLNFPSGYPTETLFHPTFLYEFLWNLSGFFLLIALDKKFNLGGGRLFLLYVIYYTFGRFFIELLRIDNAEIIFGLRINIWTSLLVFTTATVSFVLISFSNKKHEKNIFTKHKI